MATQTPPSTVVTVPSANVSALTAFRNAKKKYIRDWFHMFTMMGKHPLKDINPMHWSRVRGA